LTRARSLTQEQKKKVDYLAERVISQMQQETREYTRHITELSLIFAISKHEIMNAFINNDASPLLKYLEDNKGYISALDFEKFKKVFEIVKALFKDENLDSWKKDLHITNNIKLGQGTEEALELYTDEQYKDLFEFITLFHNYFLPFRPNHSH
jgi:hypothetical protein